MKMEHDWIKSTLGHGMLMCKNCLVTILEASAIGQFKCLRNEERLNNEKNES